ncbi:MAG: Do family serine endopeptidase [Opitutaceae bacterium]|nr:Do family serine endopeptidase [Opitutaceae bacterium]
MKPRLSPNALIFVLAFFLAFAGTAGLTVWAADGKADRKGRKTESTATRDKKATDTKQTEKRGNLKISVDRKPINRDAPDRVSYAPVIKRTAASVVYVHSSKTVRATDMYPFLNDPALRRFFENIPGMPGSPGGGGGGGSGGEPGGRGSRKGSRIPDQTQQGLGSGIVITADGYILTNNHVIEGADDVKVSIGESNKRYDAKVVGRDAPADIAVLKIEASGLSPATFGDSEQLQVGDVVLAIGNPFGVGQSVSRGIVSALSRGVGIGPFEDFIQTDAAINPGNSGGALIDTEGRVVGINTAILSRSGGFNGVGFAIPINFVRTITEQLVNTGRVERGFLGVAPQDLTEDLTAQFKAEQGALITEVTEDSPAQKAGLKSGDVITKVNNTEIRDARHLLLTVSQIAPDTQVAVEYLRDGKPQKTTVKLGRRDDDSLARDGAPGGPAADVGVLNGVTVGDITAQMRDRLQIPPRIKGAIITEIEPDSPAARQGLREGDVILELDRRVVTDAESAVKLSEEIKGPKVMVLVFRNGRNQFLVIDESKK